MPLLLSPLHHCVDRHHHQVFRVHKKDVTFFPDKGEPDEAERKRQRKARKRREEERKKREEDATAGKAPPPPSHLLPSRVVAALASERSAGLDAFSSIQTTASLTSKVLRGAPPSSPLPSGAGQKRMRPDGAKSPFAGAGATVVRRSPLPLGGEGPAAAKKARTDGEAHAEGRPQWGREPSELPMATAPERGGGGAAQAKAAPPTARGKSPLPSAAVPPPPPPAPPAHAGSVRAVPSFEGLPAPPVVMPPPLVVRETEDEALARNVLQWRRTLGLAPREPQAPVALTAAPAQPNAAGGGSSSTKASHQPGGKPAVPRFGLNVPRGHAGSKRQGLAPPRKVAAIFNVDD